MADSGYDGSVRINTKIDSSGFNAGIKKLANSASMAMREAFAKGVDFSAGAITKVREGFTKAFSVVGNILKKVLLGGLIIFGLSLHALLRDLGESFSNLFENNLKGTAVAKNVEEIKGKFTELKYAVALAFLPLVEAAIPYIKMALDWVIQLFNKVAMVTAAFVGQKQVLQVIPGSAEKLAKATEKAKKNAQGALAAFDQINVLSKQQADNPNENPAQVATQMVPITNDILSKVQAIKDEIAAWWNDPTGKLKEVWDKFVKWFDDNVTKPLQKNWDELWSEENMTKIGNAIYAVLLAVGNAIYMTLLTVGTAIYEALNILGSIINVVFTAIGTEIYNVLLTVGSVINDILTAISGVIDGVKQSLTGLIQFLVGVFTSDWEKAWEGISNIFGGIFNGIKSVIKGAVNVMIDIINGLIRAVVIGVNAVADALNAISITVPDWVPGFGGQTLSLAIPHVTAPQIPKLATGAVIPPNSQFLAVLGDQRQGTNIEAPADLIRSIVREELQGSSSPVTVDMPVYLDGEKIYQNQKRIDMRHGKSLIAGGAV